MSICVMYIHLSNSYKVLNKCNTVKWGYFLIIYIFYILIWQLLGQRTKIIKLNHLYDDILTN